jgi:transcriptional regulator with XRE-family HTH domain
MNLKTFIEQKMTEENLTQTAFAKKTGISQSTVNNILSGATNVRADTRVKIALAFGLNHRTFDENNVVAETVVTYSPEVALSDQEKQLLQVYRRLSSADQANILAIMKTMAMSEQELGAGRDSPDKDGQGRGFKRNSNG